MIDFTVHGPSNVMKLLRANMILRIYRHCHQKHVFPGMTLVTLFPAFISVLVFLALGAVFALLLFSLT